MDFVEPAYGRRSLADVLPAVARALGARLGTPPSGLELPDAASYVVFLVDGLGARLLERHAHAAPYLSGLLASSSGPGTAGVPSTTATSLTSLGTGLTPGGHGLVGFTARVPGTNELLNHHVLGLATQFPRHRLQVAELLGTALGLVLRHLHDHRGVLSRSDYSDGGGHAARQAQTDQGGFSQASSLGRCGRLEVGFGQPGRSRLTRSKAFTGKRRESPCSGGLARLQRGLGKAAGGLDVVHFSRIAIRSE